MSTTKSANGSIVRDSQDLDKKRAYKGFLLGGKEMLKLVKRNADYIENNKIDVSTNIFYQRIAEREMDNILSDTRDISRTENITMIFKDTGDTFLKRTGTFIMHSSDVVEEIGELGFLILKRRSNIVEFDIRDVWCIHDFLKSKGSKYADHAYTPGNIPFLLGIYFKEVKNV